MGPIRALGSPDPRSRLRRAIPLPASTCGNVAERAQAGRAGDAGADTGGVFGPPEQCSAGCSLRGDSAGRAREIWKPALQGRVDL